MFCFILRIYSIVGSNSIKEGETFRFSALSQNLQKPLEANFTLRGIDNDGNPVELADTNVFISSNDVRNFVFKVSI